MDISLPNELLVQIIQHSPAGKQAILCRLSRLFHDLCVPVLYRVVEIKDSDSVALFCSAIIANPSRAGAVRSFTVDVSRSRIEHYGDLLLASLKLMLRLDHLFLSQTALDYGQSSILLEECIFPQLISCDIWAPSWSKNESVSDLVAAFLARHSTLK
ncbi:hypothetical protein MSAN_02048000 [Mycena sanguinolenta]|uniref:F-box domain-containing protein n=1 Tax=Mycena sanguinolenta TaxID=230812 RepID=A0A8H7CMY4_9AGAR|nr:hypothetical protein MSAN_02048000 [Mycena sanguinolenta]